MVDPKTQYNRVAYSPINISTSVRLSDDLERHKGGPVQTKFPNVRTCEINRDMGPEVFGRWVDILCFSCFARGG